MNNPNRVLMKKFGGIIPIQMHRAAKKFAIENGITLNHLYALAIKEYLSSRDISKDISNVHINH